MRRFLKWLFLYLHFVVSEALMETNTQLLLVTVPASDQLLSEKSQLGVLIQPENLSGSRHSPSPLHSYGKRTSGCVIWNSAAAISLPGSLGLRLSNLASLCAACFPPSHRLRFVFMLGNQKQPVSLAAAS